ncbi:MAG: NAD(P)-binding domain-containing protein, partial [Exiguobacterium sp.]|nr:NAD(P)-binding domain-containing protein [Exiguobacterium sp.]
MEIGLIGLGKMGYNLALNLSDHGHTVVGTDVGNVTSDAFSIVPTLEDVVNKLSTPRVIWTMVPAGDVTEAVLAELYERLEPGDIVIDGGNSNYKLSVARAEQF